MLPARTQPIIANSTPDMIKEHFLPIAKKLRAGNSGVEHLEKRLLASKYSAVDVTDLEQETQEVSYHGDYFKHGKIGVVFLKC